MNYIEKNKNTLLIMQSANEELKDLKILGNKLVFNNKEVNIENFDISLLLDENLPLNKDIKLLSADDIFKIINLHALTIESKSNTLPNQNNLELEMLKEKNPSFKNVTISTKRNEYGELEEYINVVDSNGFDHLLHNYYKVDLITLYKDALDHYGTNNISPEELYNIFKKRCKEVDLDNSFNINNRESTSEEFRTKIDSFEQEHSEDHHYAQGNEKHDILISNDHTVTSYENDEQGNLIQNNFNNSLNNNSSELNVNSEKEQLSINEHKEEIIKLISEEKFYQLINSQNAHSQKEENEINLFNSYIEDLLIYREYLLPELQAILTKFEQNMNNISLLDDSVINQNQVNELNKYYEMRETKEQKVTEINNKNLDLQVKKLVLEKPSEDGHISIGSIALLVAAAISLICIIIGLIFS